MNKVAIAPEKLRRPGGPRDREATEQKLISSVGEMLADDGFTALTGRALARRAGVDPMLIHRYFGGLSGLLEAYSTSADYWPPIAELGDPATMLPLPIGERMSALLRNFVDALSKRPITCEILAWEAAQRSELTDALDRRRQQWSEMLVMEFLPELTREGASNELQSILSVSVAAIYFVAIRNRNADADWAGLGVRNENGREQLKVTIDKMCSAYVATIPV